MKKAEVVPESDPFILYRNYSKQCESVGIITNDLVKIALCSSDNDNNSSQIIIGDNEMQSPSSTPLGPSGCRALVAAILGECNHEDATKYKSLKELRIYKSKLGNDGAVAVARLLRKAGTELHLSCLELSDNNIGLQGAVALGRSLCSGVRYILICQIACR